MRKKLLRSILLFIGLAAAGLFAYAPNKAVAANPTTINFQGKVVNSDGTNVANGTYSFIFRIYNVSNPTMTTTCTSTASCEWQETQASVSVTSGIFQVELGSACALTSASCNNTAGGPINFSTDNSLYLTMQFNGDTSGANGGYMSPLIHITSVPFALQADNAATLGGIAASTFVQLGATQSGNINISAGSIKAGSLDSATSAAALGIGTTNAGVISVGNVTNSTFLFAAKSSSTGYQFQNASSKNVLSINTTAGSVILGTSSAGGVNGTLVFNNTTNANTLTLVTGTTAASGGSGFTLTLPTTGASASGQCLQSGAGSTVGSTNLTFNSCGSSTNLKNAYDAGSTNGGTIALTSTGGGLILQDASTPLTGTLLGVQSNLGSLNFLTLSLVSSVPHLRVYDQTTNTNYAEIYFDHATSTAIFKANGTNTTQVGNAGGGAINIASGSGNAITITAGANSVWSTSAGTITIDANGGLNLGTSTASTVIGQTSSGTTQIQSAGGLLLGTASVAGKVSIYNGANNVVIQSAGSTAQYTITLPSSSGSANYCLANTGTAGVLQFVACGAGSTGKITLVPEYPGAVMTGDGTSNTGTMTSDFCSGSSLRNIPSAANPCAASEEHNYYTWVTTAQNDYDIWVRLQVPTDFADFAASNAIQMYGWRTDSTATTSVTLSLYNSSGTLCGTSTNVATGTATWTQTSLGGTVTAAGCSISSGNVVEFRIQMAANNKTVRAGEITINYQRS